MATVPVYNQQVSLAAQPGATVAAPTYQDFADVQTIRQGEAMQQAGGAAGRIALDMQQEANHLRVIDASNQAKERMFDLLYQKDTGALNQKGYAALNRASGKDLATETGDTFNEITSQMAETLGNQQQRQMFQQQVSSMHTQLYGTVQNHLAGEFKHYQAGTMDAAVMTAQREIGLMGISGNTSELDNAIGRIRAATAEKARIVGLPQSMADEMALKEISAAHTQAIMGALEKGNVTFANNYLIQKKGDMTPADILRVQGHVTKEINGYTALQAVQTTTQGFANRFQPTDYDRLTGIVRGMESGGRDTNADGTPLTSVKGAKFAMQVMPETAKNPGFGIEPAKDDSAAEYNRVGTQYLAALTQKYGRADLAMAAYNAGPGAVDKAMAKAEKDGNPAGWLANLPKETQSYVANGMKKFGSGQGAAPMPTEMEYVNAAIEKLGPNPTLELVTATRTAAEHQYGIIKKSVDQQNEQATHQVQQQLLANGGDINAIDPVARSKVPAEKWKGLTELARYIADPPTATNWAAYNYAVENPEKLAAMSPSDFLQFQMTNFDKGKRDDVERIRTEYMSGKYESYKSVNIKTMNDALNQGLQSIGIDAHPKHDDKKGQERLGMIRGYIESAIAMQQAQTGKRLAPTEVQDFVKQKFAKDLNFQRTFLGVDAGKTSQKMLSMSIGDIPVESQKQLRSELSDAGNPNPSDTQLMQFYWFKKDRGTI